MNGMNSVYVNGDWHVYKLRTCGRIRYYVGRISTGGYLSVYNKLKDAIKSCETYIEVLGSHG